MSEFIKKYAAQGGTTAELMDQYDYNADLTEKLDQLDVEDLDREKLYEIVLWKLNRFPVISEELIGQLKGLGALKNGEHKKAEALLKDLLSCRGIALPMASTILRFSNPQVFQIIDDRAFRVLTDGSGSYPAKPQPVTKGYLERSCEIYFVYLDKLCELQGVYFPFEKLDRILYQMDIELGNSIGS